MNKDLQENLLRRATIGDLVARSAVRFGNRIALVSGEKQVSFKELNEQSCRAANSFLALGIKRGDRVAFMTHNCLEFVYLRLGLAKIGAAPVPLNFMLKGDEIGFILNHSEPAAFFVEDSLVETVLQVKGELFEINTFGVFDFGAECQMPEGWIKAVDLVDSSVSAKEPEVLVESDDMATLMYTTGTESFPKGVMTSHLNYFMSMFHFSSDCDFKNDDTLIIDIPLFHVAGTTILMASISFGSKAILEYAADPMVTLQRTQSEKVTTWVYPPTLYHALPTVPGFENFDISSLKKCICFGAVMPQVVLENWMKIKPDIQWRNYWGQTESSPVGTTSIPKEFSQKINSIGIPDTGVTIKVFDDEDQELPLGEVGELVIRGPAVMKGYWKDEKKTQETLRNGWLHTGDLGYQDDDGYIFFVDRKKDMIKSGGENVSSQEVEAMLLRNPKVAQSAVIGTPDPYWIELVTAFVLLKPENQATEEEIIDFCKENMAGYKVPKKVVFVDSFPMSATGKLLKRQVKDEYIKAN